MKPKTTAQFEISQIHEYFNMLSLIIGRFQAMLKKTPNILTLSNGLYLLHDWSPRAESLAKQARKRIYKRMFM